MLDRTHGPAALNARNDLRAKYLSQVMSNPAMTQASRNQEAPSWLAAFILQRRPMEVDKAGIAHIHVLGVLDKRVPTVDKWLGTTDYDDLLAELGEARDNQKIKGVFIEFNTPGGAVLGNAEVADLVAEIVASGKPVLGYTDTLCASAGMSIASQCSLFYASPSSLVGSVGTITMLVSYQKFYEDLGISIEVITPAKSDLKSTHWPYQDATEDQKKHVVESITVINEQFLARVRRGRGEVADDSMRGQVFQGTEAMARNLCDDNTDATTAYQDLLSLIAA